MLKTSSLMTIIFLLSLLKYKSYVLAQSDVLRNCRMNNVWANVLACDHPRLECWNLWVRHKTPLTSAFHNDPPPTPLAYVRLITRHPVFPALAWNQAGLYWQGWQTSGQAKKQRELASLSLVDPILYNFPKVTKEAGEETGSWALAAQPWWAEGWVQEQAACMDHGEMFKPASLLKAECVRTWMWVSNSQVVLQCLTGSRTTFLFPLLLGSSLKVPILDTQSLISPSHPSTSDSPIVLSGHWHQMKFLFMPAPEHNLNSEWHVTCLHGLADLI